MPQSSRPARTQPSKPKPKNAAPRHHSQPVCSAVSRSSKSISPHDPLGLPLSTQNVILSAFAHALASDLQDPALLARIQTLKGHLYDRDFGRAFADPATCRAYAARWSASRALAYAELVVREPLLTELLLPDGCAGHGGARAGDAENEGRAGRTPTATVTCLGGGAGAELAGLVGARRHLRAVDPPDEGIDDAKSLELRVFDVADWRGVLDPLVDALGPSVPDASLRFEQRDVLATEDDATESLGSALADAVEASTLITLLFTLNELYTTSRVRTTGLLMRLGAWAKPGTRLLVVDSPGSYATVRLGGQKAEKGVEGKATAGEGGEEKRYPMQWLLDHTLLGEAHVGKGPAKGKGTLWRKVLQDDSRWFRKVEGLSYPIELEDMRYQLHLYERL